MPSGDQKQFRSNNIRARRFFAIAFFDLESLIASVEGCKNNTKKAETREIEFLKLCSYALLIVALEEQKPFFDLQCRPCVTDQFLKTLDQVGRQIYNKKQKHILELPRIRKEESISCWICEAELDKTPTIHRQC